MSDDFDRRLDERLRAAFAPPPADDFGAMARAVAAPAPARPLWPWICAAAAALIAAVLMLRAFEERRGPLGHDGEALGVLWAAAYADAEEHGFGGGCCEPGFDLSQACLESFACRVQVRSGSPLSVVGSYLGGETGGCMALLARAGDTPVCVVLLRRGQDPGVLLPADCGLVLTRRELGDLVLYALSREPVEGALGHFVLP